MMSQDACHAAGFGTKWLHPESNRPQTRGNIELRRRRTAPPLARAILGAGLGAVRVSLSSLLVARRLTGWWFTGTLKAVVPSYQQGSLRLGVIGGVRAGESGPQYRNRRSRDVESSKEERWLWPPPAVHIGVEKDDTQIVILRRNYFSLRGSSVYSCSVRSTIITENKPQAFPHFGYYPLSE